ncbi:MAG TPA: deoxyribodipyrimidine photo-lyase [Propionibacteriaceae bacterium]|nr:deoxyribodipyrimidine photo-lyase [Propionibacteriaceae bacterium]
MNSPQPPAVWWVRRDFRLADNPALLAAASSGTVVALFVLDPVLLRSAGPARTAWLNAALHDLNADLRAGGGPGLNVLRGRPAEVLPRVARAVGAEQVHVSADFAPYGRRRDAAVEAALAAAGVELQATGSPYAVAPGTIVKSDGTPFQVFTPFHRAWLAHGVHPPAATLDPTTVEWLAVNDRESVPEADPEVASRVGESVALTSWRTWLDRDRLGADDYVKMNNFPGADGTSHMSKALRWGHVHPRTLLAGLSTHQTKGAAAHARQVAWRDFFADVLYQRPDAVSEPVRSEFKQMRSDDPSDPVTAARFEAWKQGRTGYPLVDAGMRQMLQDNWMHNRIRLVTASFLIKDLHVPWTDGAAYFMEHLHDGDIAQNQLNWQWVAGCGTDAAPYFRVFNPTGQAEKFDPDADYIRRYVPELADVKNDHIFEPWTSPGGLPGGYPAPIVDHAAERLESLQRYEAMRS